MWSTNCEITDQQPGKDHTEQPLYQGILELSVVVLNFELKKKGYVLNDDIRLRSNG